MLDGRVESLPSSKSSTSTGCIPMNSSNQPTESINSICEGLGGNAKATSKVPVKVGAKGRIVLLLCEKCKQRFSYSKSQPAEINGIR
jgi:hypothetical protein